jgi:hypothetical protein
MVAGHGNAFVNLGWRALQTGGGRRRWARFSVRLPANRQATVAGGGRPSSHCASSAARVASIPASTPARRAADDTAPKVEAGPHQRSKVEAELRRAQAVGPQGHDRLQANAGRAPQPGGDDGW